MNGQWHPDLPEEPRPVVAAPPPPPSRKRLWQDVIAWQDDITRRDGDDDAWLTTYLDMITLLLVMFVVMLAFSKFEPDRFTGPDPVVEASSTGKAAPTASPGGAAQRLASQFAAELERSDLGDDVSMQVEDLRLTLQIRDRILFPSGRAELNEQGARLLARLVPMFQEPGRMISVEGHTDDVPIRTAQFPSNWELSAGRASGVVRFLIEQGVPESRLRAIGYGQTRPVASNRTEEGRAANRRVALVIDLASVYRGGPSVSEDAAGPDEGNEVADSADLDGALRAAGAGEAGVTNDTSDTNDAVDPGASGGAHDAH